MFTNFQLARKYVTYYIKAFNGKGHGMHSPFVFDFIQKVLCNKNSYHAPKQIEQLRNELLKDRSTIEVKDLGAGSRTKTSSTKKISAIAKAAVKPKKYSQLMYRLVKHYQPQNIIELGTSLGITTAYMAAANPAASITTIEGSETIAKVAGKNFQKLQISGIKPAGIKQLVGNFDDVLPSFITHHSSIDLAYIDGNHRYEPTMNYFHHFLQQRNNETIMVFDDIHWSAEMEKAWTEIQQHPQVKCTVDVFFLGFVFFRDEFKVKQNFTVRF